MCDSQFLSYSNCEMPIGLYSRHNFESVLQNALENNGFRLYRQGIAPIAQTECIQRCEILLRLVGNDGALVPPGVFIPAAERFGLMRDVDRWVIKHCFAHCLGPGRDDALICSINLAGATLDDEDFPAFVREQLREHGVNPAKVCFDIAESAVVSRLHSIVDTIYQVTELGCRIALDDFGSGLGSFRFLQDLPVNYLKIDGSIVNNMAHDAVDHAIAEAIVRMGRALGMRTVAECVENNTVLGELRQIGVDYAQGNLVYAPRPF